MSNLTLLLLNILPIFTANISDSDEFRPFFSISVDLGRFFADPRPNLTSPEELGLRTHRLAQAILGLGTQNKNAQAI